LGYKSTALMPRNLNDTRLQSAAASGAFYPKHSYRTRPVSRRLVARRNV